MKWVKGPGKNLGVPVTSGRHKKGNFRDLLAKIQGRLGSWLTDTLSVAGRAVLIQQTVLQAMPLYLITITRVPVAILEETEAICRKFLWAHSSSKQGIHLLVSWEVLTVTTNIFPIGLNNV